jgi:hypothetical protein
MRYRITIRRDAPDEVELTGYATSDEAVEDILAAFVDSVETIILVTPEGAS